eukprot:1150277-Pelagomonas_calceolata.AAC.5
MPKDKGPEWDHVTVAEPDEAEGESKAKNECSHCCAIKCASCAITNMLQTWCGCTATCAQDLQQLGQAQAWTAVEEKEEMGQEEGSSIGEDWFTGNKNDAE